MEIQQLKSCIRVLREQESKTKSDNLVLIERNKALQQWNEQILKEKKNLGDQIDKLKYEKFNLMKNFEEDLEGTKN